jgi:ribosomal protein S18 acetylase RimI-like enzyme
MLGAVETLALDDVREQAGWFDLFSRVRAEELGMQAWDPLLRDQILRLQYEAQRRGYLAQFPAAETRLILQEGRSIGWLIVDRSGAEFHCVDVAVIPEARNQGVGTWVWRTLQKEAAATARPLVLAVLRTNVRALALYVRLGFDVVGGTETHLRMEWRSSGVER